MDQHHATPFKQIGLLSRSCKGAKDHGFTGVILVLLENVVLDSQQKMNGADLEFFKMSVFAAGHSPIIFAGPLRCLAYLGAP